VHFETIEYPKIIKFVSNGASDTLKKNSGTQITKDGVNYSTLDAGQSIDVLSVNKKTLSSSVIPCLWFTNDYNEVVDEEGDASTDKVIEYILFNSGETERLLQDNEYFMYTNSTKSELVILGSGTLIKRDSGSGEIKHSTKIVAGDVISDGKSVIDDNSWYSYTGKDLTLVEM
jgi:hypothetical protein